MDQNIQLTAPFTADRTETPVAVEPVPDATAQRERRAWYAGQAQSWSGLVVACILVGMVAPHAFHGWLVAVPVGLATSWILCMLRRDRAGWPMHELVAGSTLALAMLFVPWLHQRFGFEALFIVAEISLVYSLLLLGLLAATSRWATVASRAMLAAVPPLATALNLL